MKRSQSFCYGIPFVVAFPLNSLYSRTVFLNTLPALYLLVSFTHLLTHSLTHSLTQSLTHSLTQSLNLSSSLFVPPRPPRPLSPPHRSPDGSILVISTSIEHPAAIKADTGGFVRATLKFGCTVLSPLDAHSCRVTYLLASDPRGIVRRSGVRYGWVVRV